MKGGVHMEIVKLTLQNIQQVRNLCSVANKNEGDVIIRSGKYTVDAKSIMGIFSLDLSNEVEVIFENPITVNIKDVLK